MTVFLIALLVPGPMSPGWDAAMCLPGRYDRPRYYFSECSTRRADPQAWCAPYKTRFAVRTGFRTKEKCEDVVKQNHPNMWRYRNKRRKPIICDFNLEGPLPDHCHVERQPVPAPTVVRPPVEAEAPTRGAVPGDQVVAAPPEQGPPR